MVALDRALPAFLCIVLAGCGSGVTSLQPTAQPTDVAQVTSLPVTQTPAVTPRPEPPTASPTPEPTPPPASTAVPPKPSGLEFRYCCGEGGDGLSSVTWTAPRADGVEIRVYGVTRCFPASDGSDESCLREHTTLPDDIGVLLATAPASKGEVAWQQSEGEGEGCTYEFLSEGGQSFYSVVVGAYNARGPSIFAIADEGYADTTDACAPYVIRPGDTLRSIAADFGVTTDALIAENESTLSDPNKLQVGGTILIPLTAP